MKKWIEKQRDKISLILFTVIGLTLIVVTYIVSFRDGMKSNQGSITFDISKFGMEYSTYCINTLIFYSYVKIRKLQRYKIQRKTEKLLKINKIDNITLPNNTISESVEINLDSESVKYDLFYIKSQSNF